MVAAMLSAVERTPPSAPELARVTEPSTLLTACVCVFSMCDCDCDCVCVCVCVTMSSSVSVTVYTESDLVELSLGL